MLAAVPAVGVTDMPCTSPTMIGGGVTYASELFGRDSVQRTLEAGEALVLAGTPKTHIYRIVSGLACRYWQNPEGVRTAVGFSFEGEVVGLGGLDRNVTSIEASVPTVVQCLPRDQLDDLVEADKQVALRHAASTHEEMELLKQGLVAQGRSRTLERVAALLTALSSSNEREGRQGDLITDDITCGFVADQLGLGIDVLEDALVNLGRLGLVEPAGGGALRLRNRQALEQVAEGVH